jgi:hypothetical protein
VAGGVGQGAEHVGYAWVGPEGCFVEGGCLGDVGGAGGGGDFYGGCWHGCDSGGS